MKIKIMKQEALDYIKENLEAFYLNYFTEETNNWVYEVYGGDPFIDYDEIPDFELNLDEDRGFSDLLNCKIIYQNLKNLTDTQACSENLWAGLSHTAFYGALRKRYQYTTKESKDIQKDASAIASRFFFQGTIRKGKFRNLLSKSWWVGRLTYDPERENPFEKLDIIGSESISTKISDIFYNNNFAANPEILDGIVGALRFFRERDIYVNPLSHLRPALQELNKAGGAVVLDELGAGEIEAMFTGYLAMYMGEEVKTISSLKKKPVKNLQKSSIPVSDRQRGRENPAPSRPAFSKAEEPAETNQVPERNRNAAPGQTNGKKVNSNLYIPLQERSGSVRKGADAENRAPSVQLGDKVRVRHAKTGAVKKYAIQYNEAVKKIPEPACIFLGCHKGEAVTVGEETYIIDQIEKPKKTG